MFHKTFCNLHYTHHIYRHAWRTNKKSNPIHRIELPIDLPLMQGFPI